MSETYQDIKQRAEFLMAKDRQQAEAEAQAPNFLAWKALLERKAQRAEDNSDGTSQRIVSFLDTECSLAPCPPRPTKPISPSTTGWGGWGDPGFGE